MNNSREIIREKANSGDATAQALIEKWNQEAINYLEDLDRAKADDIAVCISEITLELAKTDAVTDRSGLIVTNIGKSLDRWYDILELHQDDSVDVHINGAV